MRRLLLLTLTTALVAGLSAGPASGANATVSITNYSFSPDVVGVGQGQMVTWYWMEGTHRVRDETAGLGFINSGPPDSPEASHHEVFAAAGTYRYICTIHASMDGRVRVRMRFIRYTENGMLLRWSADDVAPDGYEYDVQVRVPGSTTWTLWKDGVRRPNGAYQPVDGVDGYTFRSRVRRIGVGATAWSPVLTVNYEGSPM